MDDFGRLRRDFVTTPMTSLALPAFAFGDANWLNCLAHFTYIPAILRGFYDGPQRPLGERKPGGDQTFKKNLSRAALIGLPQTNAPLA